MMSTISSDAKAISSSDTPSVDRYPELTIQGPLSRRGHGPGLLLLVDAELDLRKKHEKTLDPPPLYKWAEEGFAVAQLRVTKSNRILLYDSIRSALSKLLALPSCDQIEKIGIISEKTGYIPI